MDINEAIKHCKKKSLECKNECGHEHRQLAVWLTQLKKIKQIVDTKDNLNLEPSLKRGSDFAFNLIGDVFKHINYA